MATKNAPFQLTRNPDYALSAQLNNRELGEHEGYPRDNNGDWIIVDSTGLRVGTASFRGKAKRGQAYCAPDPEGLEHARLMAASPDLLEALKSILDTTAFAHDGPEAEVHERALRTIRKAEGAL